MKLSVNNIKEYRDFCGMILDRIYTAEPIFTHFTKIHDLIKKCEMEAQIGDIHSLIPYPISNLVTTVTVTTGPKFLDSFFSGWFTKDLNYRSYLAGSWFAPEEILDYKMSGYSGVYPLRLDWTNYEASQEKENCEHSFLDICEDYRKALGAAFFAHRFGENHPFNKIIKGMLVSNFPYFSDYFKNLLKINEHYMTHLVQNKDRIIKIVDKTLLYQQKIKHLVELEFQTI
jgi:hypothetical protein